MSGFDRKVKKKPMAEINVVPYIDVMLVLLIVFMVAAPMLTQGVKVELPQAASEPIDNASSRIPIPTKSYRVLCQKLKIPYRSGV